MVRAATVSSIYCSIRITKHLHQKHNKRKQ